MSYITGGREYIKGWSLWNSSSNTDENGRDSHRLRGQMVKHPHDGQISSDRSHETNSNLDFPNYYHTQKATASQQRSRTAALQDHADYENNLGRNDAERVARTRELEDRLTKLQKESNEYRGDRDRAREELNGVRTELDRARKRREELEKKLELSIKHSNKESKELLQKSEEIYRQRHREWDREVKKNYDAAIAQIEKQKLEINELTMEISHGVKTHGITTRGDDYFEQRFASLEGAIRQWVFRSFRSISGLQHQDLPPTMQTSLKATIFKHNAPPDSKVSTKEVQAAIIERLRAHVFNRSFVLTIEEQLYDIERISEALGVTDLEKREWHAQTFAMILKRDNYEDSICRYMNVVERDLQDCLSVLLKGDGKEQRCKSLFALIEQSAKLQLEIFQQVSPFRLYQIRPGAQYDPSLMDDISSLADEDNTGTQNFIVRVIVFPPILRSEFDEDGRLSGTLVVRKGTVTTMLAEDRDEQGKSQEIL